MKLATFVLGITIALFCVSPATAIDVGAGVNFSTDNAQYNIIDAFTCNDLVVFNDALKLNTGNITCENMSKTVLVCLHELNNAHIQIKFESNITIDNIELSNGFQGFAVLDSNEYGIYYSSTAINYQYDTAVSGEIDFSTIPSNIWLIHHEGSATSTPTPSPAPQSSTPREENFNELFDCDDTWSFLSVIFGTYEENCGGDLFWLIIILIPFTMTWIKQQSVIIPSMLALICGSTLFVLLPVASIAPIKILLILGISGLVYHMLKAR